MDRLKKIPGLSRALGVLAIALVCATTLYAGDVDHDKRLFDRERLQIHTGTAAVNSGSATWTNWTALVTVVPNAQHALYNARIVVDLDTATTGWATLGGSATITFSVARMVDGTHWRVANNVATTALSGSNASGLSIELPLGEVGPTEQVALYAKVSSATGLAVVSIPYVLYYRAGVAAVLTLAN